MIKAEGFFTRWRHSRGFGVHSPFAFRVISDVIRLRYSYYGYDLIDTTAHSHGATATERKEARFLLRIVGRLGIQSVVSSHNALADVAFRSANSKISIHRKPFHPDAPTLLYAPHGTFDKSFLESLMQTEGSVALLRNLTDESLKKAARCLHCGLELASTDSLLLIARKGMGRMRYVCNF